MKRSATKVKHSLWKELCRLDKVAARKFPTKHDPGFGSLGLILANQLERCGYWCTPQNALTFARTGGNGVHFSFIVLDGEVNESSPVVITIPNAFGEYNFIGGESLFDFLCL